MQWNVTRAFACGVRVKIALALHILHLFIRHDQVYCIICLYTVTSLKIVCDKWLSLFYAIYWNALTVTLPCWSFDHKPTRCWRLHILFLLVETYWFWENMPSYHSIGPLLIRNCFRLWLGFEGSANNQLCDLLTYLTHYGWLIGPM